MKMRYFVLVPIFLAIFKLAYSQNQRLWPEINIYVSQKMINSTLQKALSNNKTVKSLEFHFNPRNGYITVKTLLRISLERFQDPTLEETPYFFPLPIEFTFKPEVLREGGLGLLFKSLILGEGEDQLPEIRDFSYFVNLFKILLLETNLGDLIQDKINLTAEEIRRLQELTEASFEVHLEALFIKKDIKFVGSSVLLKLQLDELFQGDAVDMSAMDKPKLWALEPSIDFNHVPPQEALYIAIGETVEDNSVFKKALEEKRAKVKKYLEGK